MGRETEIRELPANMPEILPARAVQIEAAQDALAVQAMTAKTLATQLGYEGSLTVGALEDEIRFYQRRTVEAILETGKRLLLLKELTPHGEFSQRAELLGFHIKTAQRFMKAASKTSKSDKLSFLSTQVKSSSAFLELVTHDDDALEVLAEMDGVDRMSASELRAALREAKAEGVANQSILDNKNAKIDKLERAQKRIQAAPPNEVLADLQKEATAIMNDALGAVRGGMRQALIALKNHGTDDNSLFMAGLVGQLQADISALREEFNLPDVSNAAEAQLAAEVAEWSKA